jgi:glycosyltransferase involved in cell wall biosynthesis
MNNKRKAITVVLPVHNEQAILLEQVQAMCRGLSSMGLEHEILLVENGSTDLTLEVCEDLSRRLEAVRAMSLPAADYGTALKVGILHATRDIVIVFNVEFWSLEFVEIALAALQTRTLVIGSKSAPGAHDERPFLRRFVTRSYNTFLRFAWGFDGTDTHGMKAFHRVPIMRIAESCRCTGFVFDTELVLRCQREGIQKLELPTDAREVRSPSPSSLMRRVPSVLTNLWTLWWTLR